MSRFLGWFIGVLDLRGEAILGILAIIVPGLAVISARLLHCPRLRSSLSLLLWMALLGWLVAWFAASPDHWLEILALSGAGGPWVFYNRFADILKRLIEGGSHESPDDGK